MLIKFYQESEIPYGIFSNFYKCDIIYNDMSFKSTEHLYQYLKFLKDTPINREYRDVIRNASTPNISKLYGHLDVPSYLLKYTWAKSVADRIKHYKDQGVEYDIDYDSKKDSIMYDILKLKFQQHKEFREDTYHDYYWGLGKDGSGKNILGKILV